MTEQQTDKRAREIEGERETEDRKRMRKGESDRERQASEAVRSEVPSRKEELSLM